MWSMLQPEVSDDLWGQARPAAPSPWDEWLDPPAPNPFPWVPPGDCWGVAELGPRGHAPDGSPPSPMEPRQPPPVVTGTVESKGGGM